IAILSVLGVAPSAHAGGVPTTTVVVSTPDPSIPGMSVTFAAFVFPTFSTPFFVPPTGSVRFEGDVDQVNPIFAGTLTTYPDLVGASPVVSGIAQFTFPFQAALTPLAVILEGAPNERVTACYFGDAIYAPSCGAVSQGFVSGETTLTLMSSSNPSWVGESLRFVAVVNARAGIPSGQVRFTDATTLAFLGSAPLDATGRAVLPPTLLGLGLHFIQATYVPSLVSLYFIYSGSTNTLGQIVLGWP